MKNAQETCMATIEIGFRIDETKGVAFFGVEEVSWA